MIHELSVTRQVAALVDAGGEVTLAQSYTPYGEVLATEGEAVTSYAFTGEACLSIEKWPT